MLPSGHRFISLSATIALYCGCIVIEIHFAVPEINAARALHRRREGKAFRLLSGERFFACLSSRDHENTRLVLETDAEADGSLGRGRTRIAARLRSALLMSQIRAIWSASHLPCYDQLVISNLNSSNVLQYQRAEYLGSALVRLHGLRGPGTRVFRPSVV